MYYTDSRFFAANDKWRRYCGRQGITDPFEERQKEWEWTANRFEILPRDPKWEMRRDEYLRLEHKFLLWEYHFWMDWERLCKIADKKYSNIEYYLPCDCAGRQCSMECEYFGGRCPRWTEELECPIDGWLEDDEEKG